MRELPPDRLRLPEAAEKYHKHGFTWGSLHKALVRKRLQGFRYGSTWYTTDRAVRKYIKDRHVEKIPKRYRKKT